MTAQIAISMEIVDERTYDDNIEDAERRESYAAGDWHWVGVRAKAEIRIPHGQDWITSTITSPGLWRIESDSDDSYFDEVYRDERATLIGMIESLRSYELV